MTGGRSAAFIWFRILLGIVGLGVVAALVRHAGTRVVLATLRDALPWLPLLCALESGRILCEAAASHLAFGPLATRMPRATLLRAHVIGHSLGAVAPAPSVVNETIKATLFAPYVGAGPAACVAFINQAATFLAVGLSSIPCGLAILALDGASLWFWACAVHTVVLVGLGLGLRASGFGPDGVGRDPAMAVCAFAFADAVLGFADAVFGFAFAFGFAFTFAFAGAVFAAFAFAFVGAAGGFAAITAPCSAGPRPSALPRRR